MGSGRKEGQPLLECVSRSYLTFVIEEQKQVGVPVTRAAPMLSHTLAQLLQSMRVPAQLAESWSQRIAITRDITFILVDLYSMRRGFDLSFTLGSQVLRLPDSAGLVFNFHSGKTLRKSVEAVVLADVENPQT